MLRRTRILIVLMTVLFTMMIFTPAVFAEIPPDTGDLIIHKFVGAPVGGAGDGTELDTSGWTGVLPVNGVKFDLYKVGAAIQAAGTPPTDIWPEIPPVGTFLRNTTSGNLEVYDASDTLIGEYALTVASPASVTTATVSGEVGVAVAGNLAQGIYLVIEDLAGSNPVDGAGDKVPISGGVANFLVSVPMTNPDGNGWLEEVHVYPKNEPLTIEKEPSINGEDDAISVGDVITYTIISSVPSNIDKGKSYYVTDTLDPALTYIPNSLEVRGLPQNDLLKELDAGVGEYTISLTGQVIRVDFLKDEFPALKSAGYTKLEITFDVVVNETLFTYIDNTISNKAKVGFTNENDDPFEAESDETDIHAASVSIRKLDENGNALAGAEFKIASSQANAEAGNFIRKNPNPSLITGMEPGALVDYNGTVGSNWDLLGAANDYMGSTSGNVTTFSGLRNIVGAAYQTYWIVETKAPAGYNLLGRVIKAEFDSDSEADEDYRLELPIKNSKKFILPLTGGMGTVIFTVTGIVLLGLSVLLIIYKKRSVQ